MKIIVHYDLLIDNNSVNQEVYKLLCKFKQNKDHKLFIYSPKNKEEVVYYLNEHKIDYDGVVDKIDNQTPFYSAKTDVFNKNTYYSLMGRLKYKIGDVVELKSGSHPMTVVHVDSSTKMCTICLFDENASLQQHVFHINTLKKTSKTLLTFVKDLMDSDTPNKDD